MIRTTCPQCGREDAIADYLASLPVLCKKCGHRVTMGEVLAPAKPMLPPAPVVATPPPVPPPPPPVVTAPLPKPKPQPASKPQPKPEPAIALAAAPPPSVHKNGDVVPRSEFLHAANQREVVDLFEEVPVLESRTEYVPPLPLVPAPTIRPATEFHRGRRFAARLITLMGAILAFGAGILLVGYAPPVVKNDPRIQTTMLFLPLGLYALYNLVMLGSHGQDFGKRALGLRVVGDDGSPARFGRAFLRRELVLILLLVGLIPFAWKLYTLQQAGTLAQSWQHNNWRMLTRMPEVLPAVAALLFSVLNAVLIFNPDGKCIHDRLAKTRVARG